jgi:hypothetical protein
VREKPRTSELWRYEEMKKFRSFGRTSINIGIIIPAIPQRDIFEIINTYTVLNFEISLMILTAMTYGDGRHSDVPKDVVTEENFL